jgi:hypothetical protein
MSFLTPWFLLGALAVAGPILFHLIRRSTRQRKEFSSLMFLKPTPPRVTRKSRLEDLWLLLLRCLVIAALAFGFARPFFKDYATTTGPGRRVVVLIDQSASMQRKGLWERARAEAKAVLDGLDENTEVSVALFSDATQPILTFNQTNATPDLLKDAQPNWAATHLDDALANARDWLDEATSTSGATPGRDTIILITDLQRGSRRHNLAGMYWPETGPRVEIKTIAPDTPGNAGLQLVRKRGTALDPFAPPRVRVVNDAQSATSDFQLGWQKTGDTNLANAITVTVPPGNSWALTAPKLPDHNATWQLVLTGDPQPFDNHLHLAPIEPEQLRVHIFTDEPADDIGTLRFYLRRAFRDSALQQFELFFHAPDIGAVALDDPRDRLAIITSPLSAPTAAAVRAFCQKGAPALLVLKEAKDAATLGALAGAECTAREADATKPTWWNELDFDHPLLAPFDEPELRRFDHIQYKRHRTLDISGLPRAASIARFADGDSALVHVPIGKGHLVVLTAGWHPADSQLARSPAKFVPLLFTTMELGRTQQLKWHYAVGQPIPLPPEAKDAVLQLKMPGGKVVNLDRGAQNFTPTEPGIYMLPSLEPPLHFAVNLPPAESRTTPLDEEGITALNLPIFPKNADSEKNVNNPVKTANDGALEDDKKLWRWLILAAILLVILETWLGGWLARRPAKEDEEKGGDHEVATT